MPEHFPTFREVWLTFEYSDILEMLFTTWPLTKSKGISGALRGDPPNYTFPTAGQTPSKAHRTTPQQRSTCILKHVPKHFPSFL